MAADRIMTIDANEAVADIAYRLSEVVAIYPITPASPMAEHADEWASTDRPNLWGAVPEVTEMQSEGGAAGAVHGALQAGALTTTFTASQGLLLMLPNLYKIAGELTPFCLHVAARSIATHALSIFGDHSDVMATRGTGLALLASGSPQEAADLAAVAHAATLRSRVPFLHFFDGFRTSHELQKVAVVGDETLRALIDEPAVEAHRARALSPDHPVVRGTAHNPDTFFQATEAANPFHDACPGIVAATMAAFGERTGRRYRLFDYVGHPEAERVLVMMGSGAEAAHEAVEHLVGAGERVGLVKVRLYRPFAVDAFLDALPPSVRGVAVLDRSKEPGSVGEPLVLDVTAALVDALARGRRAELPRLIGGRYGLSSKEFTPAMAKAALDELEASDPRPRFTVGINDDVTHLSLPVDDDFHCEDPAVTRAVFYGLGSDGTVSSNKASIKIIGDRTDAASQGYFVYDSKKSGAMTVSHLRFGPGPIRATYQIRHADLVAVHDPGLLDRVEVLERARPGATVLLNVPGPTGAVWAGLPREVQDALVEKRCRLYAIDAAAVAASTGLGRRINTIMQTCFFELSDVLDTDEAIDAVKESVAATWGRRGPEVVRRNVAAIDAALAGLHEIPVPDAADATRRRRPAVPDDAPDFVQRVTRLLLEGHGDRLPVSAFPPDGTWPTGTSRYEKRAIALDIPVWEPDVCIQCNRCSMICPHTAIVTRAFEPADASGAPAAFRSQPETHTPELEGLSYVVQVAPDDCTGCGLCVEVCPGKDRSQPKRRAINMRPAAEHREREREAFSFLREIPEIDRTRIPRIPRALGLLPARFEFSGACAGCGETPYIRTLTQLFGDRLVIGNATGCSSIYGGNLPTTPYTTDADGRGPAWSNSLFEDDAEFALGLRLGVDVASRRAHALLDDCAAELPPELVAALDGPCHTDEEVAARRRAIAELRRLLAHRDDPPAQRLSAIADELVPRSVWAIGGDGWAYDIGFGGLDHVLASGRDVNVLVLDTEVYSNTGGQQSKATPLGAVAKFAAAGKATRKKDLGLLAMSYGHVYVASVAIQARSRHTLEALRDAETYPGPSLVIAHSPCIAHGYDLVDSPAQQGRAIASGAWPLYRFDPRRLAHGEPPLVVDADPTSLPVRSYMEHEARFRMVELRDPTRYEELVAGAEAAIRDRHALYEQLARIALPPEEPHHG
ncbi:pyruvate:ferredoxin (flavodoxin) oxidoreductase [Rhabdothermincola salaria]|uniref:pyruvate:ferredoxin (flavodoxin) oxidoreductase n=1 Tax=Rhabdothermincola salaria TaxID=2903142 RepID=UPI001E4E1DE3|nr:pyruvate:ferredoxin (flavodoxin) oxidoreductase [Rhabdothermincola salaria]MCD9622896.1 pyruvate:ferredoxin (flavodoxin) oxidoreductase [Rhabdothermincola salaria]